MVYTEAEIEGSKLRIEALKHQATFSAGAVLGVAAITKGIVLHKTLPFDLFLTGTYIVLLLTISVSLLLMHLESLHIEQTLQRGEAESRGWIVQGNYLGSMFGLPVALVLFILYMWANLPQ